MGLGRVGCAEAGRRRGPAGGVRAETRPRARGPPAEPAPAGPPGACPAPRPLLPPEAPRRGCVGHQGLLALAPRPWCLVLPQGPVSPPLAQRGYRETPLGPRDPPSAVGWPQGTGSGPLCHALAPVPGLLGELNVLRSPSPRPRSRSRPPFSERGQRQVLDAGTRGMLRAAPLRLRSRGLTEARYQPAGVFPTALARLSRSYFTQNASESSSQG